MDSPLFLVSIKGSNKLPTHVEELLNIRSHRFFNGSYLSSTSNGLSTRG